MPKCVIVTLFVVFAGTPSLGIPSGRHVLLNSAAGQTVLGSYFTELSHYCWIVQGYLWLGLIIVEHSSLTLADQQTLLTIVRQEWATGQLTLVD